MKRTFTLGSGTERKIVVIEIDGAHLAVKQKKGDGDIKRHEKDLSSEGVAQSECERMVRELISRGFVEQTSSAVMKARPAKPVAQAARVDALDAYEDVESSAPASEPLLPRLGTAPVAASAGNAAPKKKKKAGGKKKKKAESGDGLDKRVLGAVFAVGAVGVALVAFFIYDAFLKPPTIVGTWAGSMIDFEIGKPIIHSKYRLVLDEQKRASLTLEEKYTSIGTYSLKGNRLKLTLKDVKDDKEEQGEEGGGEGEASERDYKISLGRATLDLYDPSSGKQLVQLIRFLEKPSVKAPSAPASASKDLVASATGAVDKDADARLASVEFAPKDNAFKARYPKGWTSDTGSRPDNTYSWASFTQGSAKIQIFADVTGSLMSGSSNQQNHEEGSELAPVHNAHMLYQKTISEEFSEFKEGKPTLFKGSSLGEGRIAAFTASTGSILGTTVRGYRVTYLTNDRRVTVLSQCPLGEFDKFKPTFLAVSRSLSR